MSPDRTVTVSLAANSRAKLAAFVSTFVGELELVDHLTRRILNKVEHRSGLIRVRCWKYIEKPMKSEDGRIGDQNLTKQ